MIGTYLIQEEAVHPMSVILKVLENLTLPVPLHMDTKNLHLSSLVLEDKHARKIRHTDSEIDKMTLLQGNRIDHLMSYRDLLLRCSLRFLTRHHCEG